MLTIFFPDQKIGKLEGIRLSMQDGACEHAVPLSQMLKEAYSSGQVPLDTYCDSMMSESSSHDMYFDSLSDLHEDGLAGSPVLDLSAFLNQEEMSKSLDLARVAIAENTSEDAEEPELEDISPYLRLRPPIGLPARPSGLSSPGIIGRPEPSSKNAEVNVTGMSHSPRKTGTPKPPSCEVFLGESDSHWETSSHKPDPTHNSETREAPIVQSQNPPRNEFCNKAVSFIEELSSIFRTVRPRHSSQQKNKTNEGDSSSPDSGYLSPKSHSKIAGETGAAGSSLRPALDSESGVKSCSAEQEHDAEDKTAEGDLPGTAGSAPRFTQKLRSQEVTEGSTVRLECRVLGNPQPLVRWFCEGRKLENTPDIQIFQDGDLCTLAIAEAFEDDTGRYACTTTNCFGTDSTSAEIYVEGASSTDSEGEGEMFHSQPGGTPQSQKKTTSVSLTIGSPHSKKTAGGPDVQQVRSTLVQSISIPAPQIQSPPPCLPVQDGVSSPVFTKVLQDINASDGQVVVLECRVKGSPPLKVQWQRQGTEIEDSPDFRILQKKPRTTLDPAEEICTLMIAETFAEDAGTFTCIVTNPFGSVSCSADLTLCPGIDVSSNNGNGVMNHLSPSPQTEISSLELPPKRIVDPVQVNSLEIKPSVAAFHLELNSADHKHNGTSSRQELNGPSYGHPTQPIVPLLSPIKEPPPLAVKPKLDPLRLQQLQNQVLLEQQAGKQGQQSLELLLSSPTSAQPPPAPMSVLNPHTPPAMQQTTTFNYARPKQFIAAQSLSSSAGTPQSLKRNSRTPRLATDEEIQGTKDAVIQDLERKLRFKDERVSNGQRLTYEEKMARRLLGADNAATVFNFQEAEEDQGAQQDYKVSSFEQRLISEIEFRLERSNTDESDDEVFHDELPPQCSAPTLEKKLKHIKLFEGNPFTFTCKVSGQPMPKVYWFKDGNQISKRSEHYQIGREPDGTCSLHTKAATLDDDGNYTIMLANPQGRISCTGRLMVQTVSQRGRSPRSPAGQSPGRRPRSRSRDSGEEAESIQERFFRPHFLQAPGDMVIQEGKLCRMDCKVSGLPTPDLIWQLNGNQICPDSSHKMLVRENGVHSLVIEPATARDAGMYTCIATNRAGQNSFNLELVVAAKEMVRAPTFIEKLQNTGVAEGHPIRVECRVAGVPYPQIFWKKDNESLTQNTERVSMHHDNRGYLCLLIQPTTKEDAAWYTVSAKNEAGIISCTAKLDVYSPQWHQTPVSKPKKVRPSASRYAVLTDQGLDIKSAFLPEANPIHLATQTSLVESDDL
ncbi:palladin isoform X4 [Amblyraja radiata]|uniref:palladin isoform X4 n=1 Tax=Amblyraja radiata TaxID=386614 RepID=UPI001402D148|nr:palladin isoform X4 [Amblyraja radiata]